MTGKFTTGITLLLLILMVAGCARATQEIAAPPPAEVVANTEVPPTEAPPPTDTALPPTDPPEPTPALALPTNTPLPEGVLFRDDFNGEFQPGWEWENENPERWSFTDDGWLRIIGEDASLLGDNYQSNLLWYDLPAGDFVVTAHIKTMPIENFQQTTIYIYEDPENYIALNRGYCDICDTGGGGIYMEYKIGGDWGGYSLATDAEEVTLRLESSNNMISGYYAFEEGQWTRLGRFGNYFDFTKVGIGVTNINAPSDLVGMFDYFEISLP